MKKLIGEHFSDIYSEGGKQGTENRVELTGVQSQRTQARTMRWSQVSEE